MKQVGLLFLILVSAVCKAQIPNNSFENWRLVGADTVLDAGWHGSDITLQNKVFIYTQQGTESRRAFAGNNFIEVNHKDSAQSGKVTLGYLQSKFPYTQRPKSFSFSGIYLPQLQGEAFAVLIVLTNGNDTLSYTWGRFNSITIANWSKLSINLNYASSSTLLPDSCHIRFQLLPTQSNTVNLSTTLFVDDLQFSNFPVSVPSLNTANTIFSNATIYPNPASNTATLSFKLAAAALTTATILDISGKEILSSSKHLNAGDAAFNFDISALKSGVYIYQIKTNNTIVRGKLSIQH